MRTERVFYPASQVVRGDVFAFIDGDEVVDVFISDAGVTIVYNTDHPDYMPF